MMDETQKRQLGEVLEQAAQRLLTSAQRSLVESIGSAREETGDSIDASNSEEIVSTNLRLRDREQKLLAKIRAAQQRLDDGVIDECESCGEPIAFKRLLARPVTTLCIECKESAEEEERRQGSVGEEVNDSWPLV
jgi:DnaK suppressor protein